MTLGDLNSALLTRLGDADAFWPSAERVLYLQEALRTWNATAQFYRDRSVFQTVAGTAFYDLSTKLPALLGRTITDTAIVELIEYHLIEPPTPAAWTGTDQFTLAAVTGAVERRRDQFLLETGIVLTHPAPTVSAPGTGRVALDGQVIDVRRAAWKSATGTYTHLWRDDEHNLNAYARGWSVNPDTPAVYSMIATPPWRMQIAPVPADVGELDLLTVQIGATLNPAAGVLLGVPDDFAWVVKWGALADLLGEDGPARDTARAAYCETRWREGISLARLAAGVIQAEINGSPVFPCSVNDLDAGYPGWQTSSGAPDVVAAAGLNIIALADVPDGVYSVTLDVVRNAPIPAVDGDTVTIGREEMDVIVDYAQHLACFKMGGAEFEATVPCYERLLRLAAVHNDRLRAQAQNFGPLSKLALRQGKQEPRRKSDAGLEALEYANS